MISNKIKILWFSSAPSLTFKNIDKENNIGGWVTSLEEMIKKHDKVELAVSFKSTILLKNKYYFYGVTYYPVYDKKFSIKKRYLNEIDSPKLIKRLLYIIEDYKPDIIHVFGTENHAAIITMYTNIPVVIHIQGLILPLFINFLPKDISINDLLLHSSFYKILKGSGAFKSYHRFKKMAKREINIVKSTNYFSGRTEWDKAYIRLLNPDAKYYHIDEALRESFYSDTWTYPKDEKIHFLSVIGPNIYKGLDMVMKTANKLKIESSYDFIWNIVGINEKEEVLSIIEKIYKIKFNNVNVRFLGKKNPDAIVNLMKKSHLFIHPSHIDNSPNSVCEAMMVGIPVIAANVGGLKDIIKDGYSGFLYKDYEIEALMSIILYALNNRNILDKISIQSKVTALKRHDKNRILKDTINLYENMIKK